MVKKMLLPVLCAAFIVVFGLSACNSKRVYDEYQFMVDANVFWPKSDVKTFEIPVPEAGSYVGYLVIRHSFMIGISNIPVKVELTAPSGKKTVQEHNVVLRGADGKVVGEAMGETTDLKFKLPELAKLEEKGNYKLSVAQVSETASITGIAEVGIELDKP